MTSIIRFSDPLEIIENSIMVGNDYLKNSFINIIKKLYQYELFKPFLDLVATKAIEKRLIFCLYDKKIFDLNEGECKTIEGGITNKFFNKLRTEKKYIITIKKITAAIIVHEIAHFIEQESGVRLNQGFYAAIQDDITNNKVMRVKTLSNVVNHCMITELKLYPDNQHASELFARYFQIMTYSKEISGKTSKGFDIIHLYTRFQKTEKWLWDNLYQQVSVKVEPQIANQSQCYITPQEHKWSQDTVESFYQNSSKSNNKWSSNFKSIKDDPFK